jgi:hypothetical protein
LERLQREKLHAKLEKCELFLDSVSFLKYVISDKKIAIDLEKVGD